MTLLAGQRGCNADVANWETGTGGARTSRGLASQASIDGGGGLQGDGRRARGARGRLGAGQRGRVAVCRHFICRARQRFRWCRVKEGWPDAASFGGDENAGKGCLRREIHVLRLRLCRAGLVEEDLRMEGHEVYGSGWTRPPQETPRSGRAWGGPVRRGE